MSILSQNGYTTQKDVVQNLLGHYKPDSGKDTILYKPEMDVPVMCIQWENKELNELNRNNRFFDLLDEMFLRTYTEWVSTTVEKVLIDNIFKEKGIF